MSEPNSVLRPVSEFKESYVRVRELGRGKFGVVYKVERKCDEDKDGGEKDAFAAKHVRARNQDVREKTLEEIVILSSLSNPHILAFEAAYESVTEIIVVTEYLSGGELFERVASEQFDLTEAECIQFMKQICEGVEYLHKMSIVHLDLKPENIVCCRADSNDIKIIDFGLAKLLKPGDQVKVMCGTAEFVSPEIVNYDIVSFFSDVWSLGVIAYVLLTGLSPFMGDSVAETYSNVSKAEYDFDEPEFDVISESAKDFISCLLVREPNGRLSATECLQHSWLAHEETEEEKTRRIDKANLRRFLARRRWQRCGQAIRAMKRMSGLMQKRRSTQSMDVEDPTPTELASPFAMSPMSSTVEENEGEEETKGEENGEKEEQNEEKEEQNEETEEQNEETEEQNEETEEQNEEKENEAEREHEKREGEDGEQEQEEGEENREKEVNVYPTFVFDRKHRSSITITIGRP